MGPLQPHALTCLLSSINSMQQKLLDRKKHTRSANCSEIGHWKLECPRPPRSSPQTSSGPLSVSAHSRSPSSSPHVIPTASPHVSPYVRPQVPPAKAPRATMTFLDDNSSSPETWFADRGASHHMTPYRDNSRTLQPISKGVWPV